MRLFIALEIPEEVRAEIARNATAFEKDWTAGRLIPPENYHLTLAFLGEVPEERIGDVIAAMEACPSPPPILTIEGFGRFRHKNGDILWRQIRGGNTLSSLQRRLSRELRERGFALEKRPYVSHLTLARRCRLPEDAAPISFQERSFAAVSMALLRSDPGPNGMVYTPLYRMALEQKEK